MGVGRGSQIAVEKEKESKKKKSKKKKSKKKKRKKKRREESRPKRMKRDTEKPGMGGV